MNTTLSLEHISIQQMRIWFLLFADSIQLNQDHLTQLDTAIGDGDHGINMQRGMDAVRNRLQDTDNPCHDIPSLLRSVATTLISTVGGAAGPLYGTFFLRAATAPTQAHSSNLAQLLAMFRFGLEGVQQRGKAIPGEKTMIDALAPAVAALEAAQTQHMELIPALNLAAQAAAQGMASTIPMEARKGRASYLGPHSVGHQDPGATSAALLVAALRDAASGEER